MAIFLLIIKISMKIKDQQLKRVLFMQYLVKFKKSKTEIQDLIDSGSEINIISLVYTAILRLYIYSINIGAQKINKFIL